jgi:anti-sigma factor RsiW
LGEARARAIGTLWARDPGWRWTDLRWTGLVDGELDAFERAALHAALDSDANLERDTAFLVTGLSRVGLDRVFVRALARRLAVLSGFQPPAAAVLKALEDTIATAVMAGDLRGE